MRHQTSLALLSATLILAATPALADTSVAMHLVDENGEGRLIGHVSVTDSEHGLVLTPNLEGLPPGPGLHGFHVHEHPSCAPGEDNGEVAAAMSAGAHYDPDGHEHHGTPWGGGHRGDLPALFVDEEGRATHPVLAPRLSVDELQGLSLIIHESDDSYSDHPEALGGAGARIACGVFEESAN